MPWHYIILSDGMPFTRPTSLFCFYAAPFRWMPLCAAMVKKREFCSTYLRTELPCHLFAILLLESFVHFPPFICLLFSLSVMFSSLHLHELQHVRLPCLSQSPRVCSDSCPFSQWCHPTISSFNHYTSLESWIFTLCLTLNLTTTLFHCLNCPSFSHWELFSWFLCNFVVF